MLGVTRGSVRVRGPGVAGLVIKLYAAGRSANSEYVAHGSEPPTRVKETDVVLSNSLRYSF